MWGFAVGKNYIIEWVFVYSSWQHWTERRESEKVYPSDVETWPDQQQQKTKKIQHFNSEQSKWKCTVKGRMQKMWTPLNMCIKMFWHQHCLMIVKSFWYVRACNKCTVSDEQKNDLAESAEAKLSRLSVHLCSQCQGLTYWFDQICCKNAKMQKCKIVMFMFTLFST